MRPLVPLLAAFAILGGCVNGIVPKGVPDPSAATALFKPDCSVAPGADKWPETCTGRASFNPSPSKAEIDLAVNPKDPLNVVVASKDLDPKASDCVWSVSQVTKDGGKTWKTVYVGGDLQSRVPEALPFNCVTDPIMAFDANGVLYYALQAYDPHVVPHEAWGQLGVPMVGSPPGGSAFILARSKDGGMTYDKYVVQHVGDGNVVFHDYPRMLVTKTGAVCTIWNGVGSGGVTPWVSCTRVTFFAEDAPRGTNFESGFAMTKDGAIYVTVTKGAGPEGIVTGGDGAKTEDVFLFKSTDDARSFAEVGKMYAITPTPRQLPQNKFRTPTFVEMTSDLTDGPFANTLYTFWPDYRTNDSDVLSSFSRDGGKTWSPPARIHEDAKNDQFFARGVVGPDGTVHVLFADRSRDPANKLLDFAHAWSTDGGVTWKSQRLTGSPFDGDLGKHQDGFPFIGDYNGIRVGPDGVLWTAWGDTRMGQAEIAFAKLVKG
jgi:hypothetical protein